MFPTLVEFCGVKDGQERDGVSLVPALADPAKAKDRDVFLPGMKPDEYSIINQNWRYIHYADGTEELYNVQRDPNEWENLAGQPEYDDVKKKLAGSAPKTFAAPISKRFKRVIEGESYRWEPAEK